MLIPRRLCLLALALITLPAAVPADEGMWLFNRPPRELLLKKYGFKLDDAWLANARRASVRFNNGGSGSFVSGAGLVVTNHHIGADSLLKLSTRDRNLHRDGFHAATREEELKCPDLELNVLQDIVDVTAEVNAAVKPGLSPAEARAARGAVIARLAKESQAKTGLRSDVVTLYRGAEYQLYRYQKYTDVRLVMAPEHAAAAFGGDVDNFEFPRHGLDFCFFRVYQDGRPAQTPHHFRWSSKGPVAGDLVFVSGHPGTTNRLETLAHLKHRRDVTLPYYLALARQREALLGQYALTGAEPRRAAQGDLDRVANARKAYTGMYHGLLDPAILAAKAKRETELQAGRDAKPWEEIAESLRQLARFERRYYLLERGDAFQSRLFGFARQLVRAADEQAKDNRERLPEYRTTALDSLKLKLFSPAPISLELERVTLAGSLAFLAEQLGGDDPVVVQVLAGKSPEQRAAELLAGTKLLSVAERRRLFEQGQPALADSTDTLVRLARTVEPAARALRDQFDRIGEIHQQAYAAVSRAMFERYGTTVAPDATFTLRLAFGTVQGYALDGGEVAPFTTLAGLYARAADHGNEPPFRLPQRWLAGKAQLDLTTPLNFASTADTIGGNSGSPVLNRAGELVGINFDRNRHGLVRNFVYTDAQARHVSVHSRAVLEVLRNLYHADTLVRELTATPKEPRTK